MKKRQRNLVWALIIIAFVIIIVAYENSQMNPSPAPVATTTAPTASTLHSVTSPFIARVGRPIYIGSDVFEVKQVTDDNRCPHDVQCVQAGTIHIAVSVKDGTQNPATTVLGLNDVVSTGTHTYELIAVNPPRLENKTLVPSDYVFTFSFKNK